LLVKEITNTTNYNTFRYHNYEQINTLIGYLGVGVLKLMNI